MNPSEFSTGLPGLDKILQAAADIRTFNSGMLRIAALPALALGPCRALSGTSRSGTPTSISLQTRSSTKAMEWIAGQQFEIGFAAVQQSHPAVVQELLLEAPFDVVMPTPLAGGEGRGPAPEPACLQKSEAEIGAQEDRGQHQGARDREGRDCGDTLADGTAQRGDPAEAH